MAIKDKLTQVITQLSGDNADALKTLLREAIAEFDTVYETLTQANNESKTRKEKIKELEKQIEAKDEQLEKFNNLNPELDRLKKVEAEHLSYKKEQYDKRLSEWTEKAKVFAIPETDKRFDKINKAKDQFVFPADEKSALTDEQLAANLKAYNLLDMAGYFSTEGGGNDPIPPRPAPTKTSGDKSEKSAGQALWETMIKP